LIEQNSQGSSVGRGESSDDCGMWTETGRMLRSVVDRSTHERRRRCARIAVKQQTREHPGSSNQTWPWFGLIRELGWVALLIFLPARLAWSQVSTCSGYDLCYPG